MVLSLFSRGIAYIKLLLAWQKILKLSMRQSQALVPC